MPRQIFPDGVSESGSGFVASTSYVTPPDNTTEYPVKVAYLILISGIPATIQLLLCGLVLKIFYQSSSTRVVSALPVIHLVFSDFVRSIVDFLIISLHGLRRTTEPSPTEFLFCDIVSYMERVHFAWSHWAVVIVAHSRADTIANVLLPNFTKRQFWGFAIASWLIAIVTALPPLVGWSPTGYRKLYNNTYMCGLGAERKGLSQALYMPLFYVVNFVVPLVLVILCFLRILRVTILYQRLRNRPSNRVQKNVIMLSTRLHQDDRDQMARNRVKDILRSKTFRYIAIIVITNLVLLAPYVGMIIYTHVCLDLGFGRGTKRCLPGFAFMVAAALRTLGFNINAFLYVFWIRRIQQSILVLLCCRRKAER
jgi:hypothetical protein